MEMFSNWINAQLSCLPDEVKALNFNLYETEDDTKFEAELVGCVSYEEEDEDWACDTIYSSEDNVYCFCSENWEKALEYFVNLVQLSILKDVKLPSTVEYVTAGFIDGDLDVIYKQS